VGAQAVPAPGGDGGATPEVADRARRRITRRTLPYLFVLFVVAYLDRVNVGYAAVEMSRDLSFTPEIYGFGAGIFFLGYFLFEIPGGVLVEKWSARLWISRIMISWGVLAILTGFVNTPNQFYLIRFLLGAAEAGFFPGIIVYLSHWFRYEDRAKATAMFMAAVPLTNVFGAPASGLLLDINWLGMAGWRWLFILEGLPAIVLGVVTIFYLTDRPHQARWLPDDERAWLEGELASETRRKTEGRTISVWRALAHREVLLLAGAYFCIVTSVYGLNFWLPTIIKKSSDTSNMTASLLTAVPYCVGLVAILAMGWSSDRTRERRWHTAGAMVVGATGLLLAAVFQDAPGMALAMFCIAAAGLNGYLPSFWALPTSFLAGTAAAASVGLINSIGNLGGFVGPFVVGFLNARTGSFFAGTAYLSASALVAAFCILALRHRRAAS
jgi:ACS family tartrate transporter-like MFS transporter